jgi:hypothetical protein
LALALLVALVGGGDLTAEGVPARDETDGKRVCGGMIYIQEENIKYDKQYHA